MTSKTIMIGLVAIAFVAGSIMTSTTVFAANDDKQGNQGIIAALQAIADSISGLSVDIPPAEVQIIGVEGPEGPQGIRGEQGIQGIPGLPGADGEMGVQGESFTQIITLGTLPGALDVIATSEDPFILRLCASGGGSELNFMGFEVLGEPMAFSMEIDGNCMEMGYEAGMRVNAVAHQGPNSSTFSTISLQTTDAATASLTPNP